MVPNLLDTYRDKRVVLDMRGSMIYIGRLISVDERGYSLADVHVHDRSDGHSTKEQYISEAHELERSGSRRVTRRSVFVERHAVVAVSLLADVVSHELTDDGVPTPCD
jgi:small nuclear ribonucleoprotein (snRNP)-like protein